MNNNNTKMKGLILKILKNDKIENYWYVWKNTGNKHQVLIWNSVDKLQKNYFWFFIDIEKNIFNNKLVLIYKMRMFMTK